MKIIDILSDNDNLIEKWNMFYQYRQSKCTTKCIHIGNNGICRYILLTYHH